MAQTAPGKAYRRGITLMEAVRRFDAEEKAEAWFVAQRWPDGLRCPFCESANVLVVTSRKPQPFRCRDCRKCFSVKTGTLMHSSNLPLSKWAIAFYLFSTSLKSVSSMKLHRDLGITQKSAWYMGHRIRGMWGEAEERFAGPVEADETYVGGREKNKHASRRLRAGRGTVGKAAPALAGVKDRTTNQIRTKAIQKPDKPAIQGFVVQNTEPTATFYTDEHPSYTGIPRRHEVVRHSAAEYVNGQAHTNGVESHWAVLKRAYFGVFHHVSAKHLDRYATEFAGRHNARTRDTADIMGRFARGAAGKRLTYETLIADAPRLV